MAGITGEELGAGRADAAGSTQLVLRALGWGLARIFSIVVLALAWEWFARSGAVTPFMLPRLTAVLERIWSDRVRRSSSIPASPSTAP